MPPFGPVLTAITTCARTAGPKDNPLRQLGRNGVSKTSKQQSFTDSFAQIANHPILRQIMTGPLPKPIDVDDVPQDHRAVLETTAIPPQATVVRLSTTNYGVTVIRPNGMIVTDGVVSDREDRLNAAHEALRIAGAMVAERVKDSEVSTPNASFSFDITGRATHPLLRGADKMIVNIHVDEIDVAIRIGTSKFLVHSDDENALTHNE